MATTVVAVIVAMNSSIATVTGVIGRRFGS